MPSPGQGMLHGPDSKRGGVLSSAFRVSHRGPVRLSGWGIVLKVLKEELSEERQSRFWPFALSGAAYAALLGAG